MEFLQEFFGFLLVAGFLGLSVPVGMLIALLEHRGQK